MNERIRELAEQAGLSHMPSNYPDMADLYKGADFELEKFAELIVRECNQAVLAVPCYYKDYRAQIEEVVIHDCARAVLEHFGVE